MVKGLKMDDESETTDSIEQSNSNEPNRLKSKRTKGKQKRCQHCYNNEVDQGLTGRQANQRGLGARNRTGRGTLVRRDARRNQSEEPTKQREVELEGVC